LIGVTFPRIPSLVSLTHISLYPSVYRELGVFFISLGNCALAGNWNPDRTVVKPTA